jgi:ATP-binding cassette, subfamily B (MDR/TAP), member 1
MLICNLDLVQQATSEKVALICTYIGTFFTGFILAYARQWKLALALTSIIPCIAMTGGLMNKLMSAKMQAALQEIAEGGSTAEEVIATIRTSHAFNSQSLLGGVYNAFVEKARILDLKVSVVQGGGMGVFFFILYSSYGLSQCSMSFCMSSVLTSRSFQHFHLEQHSLMPAKVHFMYS